MHKTNLTFAQAFNHIMCGVGNTIVYWGGREKGLHSYVLIDDKFYAMYDKDRAHEQKGSDVFIDDAHEAFTNAPAWEVVVTSTG